ncbi:hypothetical protein D3C76_1493890 [compost metagenome]
MLDFFQQVQRQGDAFPFQVQVVSQLRGTLGQGKFVIGKTPISRGRAVGFEDAMLDDFDHMDIGQCGGFTEFQQVQFNDRVAHGLLLPML